MEETYQRFRSQAKTAFVLGYTGETGKALVQELVNANIFNKVLLFGRREVPFPDEEKYKCLEQRTIDYENLEAHKSDFEGCEVGYCCLGTTRGKSGKDGFFRVDHDYVMNSAKLAKDTTCKQFHLVTSTGANANSWIFYNKVKGQVEENLKTLDFNNLFIYHPALLMCDREESRPGEKLMRLIAKPIMWMSPTAVTTPTTTLGKAMVNATVTETENKVQLLDNRSIFKMAGELNEKTKSEDSKEKTKPVTVESN